MKTSVRSAANRTSMSGYGRAKSTLRRDAQTRRLRLIETAIELFEREGYEVPLETIAAHAGIGRGTLHRNFKSRAELAAAVIERRLACLTAELDQYRDGPDALYVFIGRLGLLASLCAPAISSVEDDAGTRKMLIALRTRVYRLLQKPLAVARKARIVRADLTIGEVQRAASMLMAYGRTAEPRSREQAIAEGLQILIKGMARRRAA